MADNRHPNFSTIWNYKSETANPSLATPHARFSNKAGDEYGGKAQGEYSRGGDARGGEARVPNAQGGDG